ncbi:MAG: head GIN domain-containing protein [Ginsengibacter sp.]
MKSFLILLFTAFMYQSYGQTIITDKNAEIRNVSAFSGIKVSGGIDVYLSQSDEYALAISASEDNYRGNIITEIKNGILNISYKGGSLRNNNNLKLRAYVSFKTLESLEASGACDFIINEIFKTNSIRIKLSGACNIKGKVAINDLQLNLSGASTVKIDGSVQNLKIDASGASDIKNYDLIVENCVADLSGASDVRITINQSLSAKASGASSLYYKGNPERKDISSSGASNISQRD